jgi:hypothetical protein
MSAFLRGSIIAALNCHLVSAIPAMWIAARPPGVNQLSGRTMIGAFTA